MQAEQRSARGHSLVRRSTGTSQVSARAYRAAMPEISRFFGIVVRMHFEDHRPPHFHALYGEYEVEIAIDGPRVLEGNLPPRALGLAMEWAVTHVDELQLDWELASTRRPLNRIEPLR